MRRVALTPQLIEQIALDVRAGNFVEPSARRHGVGHSTLHKWLARGRELAASAADDENASDQTTERDRLCVDLVDALEKAEAEAEVRVVAIVQGAIPTNWQAGFRWLESKARSRWLRTERRELTGRDGGPLRIESQDRVVEEMVAEMDRVGSRLLGLPAGATSKEVELARRSYWESQGQAIALSRRP